MPATGANSASCSTSAAAPERSRSVCRVPYTNSVKISYPNALVPRRCAGDGVILIGHLNKAAGGQSAYRGLGSIDFRAAARSVLLIGRVKREPNVRVIVHDKSSLAPEGKPVAFCLDPETGFSWIGEYDITADELLSGAGGNNATKTEQAERLILDLLADGKELASEDIVKAAAEAGISERTVQNAKRDMGGILGARRVGGQWYNFIKKKQPPEPAS